MSSNKKERYFWERYFGISSAGASHVNPYVKRINWRDSEIGDEELGWLCEKIKMIDQLDLDNTSITDKGIEYISRLDSLKELRLKGCFISRNCIPGLVKLKSLELLHLGDTSITLNDAEALLPLQSLKLLLLSSTDNEEVIREKAQALNKLLPGCEINVNHRIR